MEKLGNDKPELIPLIQFNWEKMQRAEISRIHEIAKFVLDTTNKVVIGGTIIAAEANKPAN